MMSALKDADPARDYVAPYDEDLLARVVAEARPAPARRRSRRAVVAVWLSVVVLPVAGVGAAAAAGLIPAGAEQAFPWTRHNTTLLPEVDLSTGVRVISAPGPEGRRFEVWVAKGRHGSSCVGRIFVGPAAAAPADRRRLRPSQGGSCSSGGPVSTGCDATWGPGVYASFTCRAHGAVRAVALLSDGSSLPVPVQNGWIGGWLPLGVSPTTAVLTSYAVDGTVLARFAIASP